MIPKLRNEYKPVTSTEWRTEAGNFTTNLVVKVDFSLSDLSATKTVTWKFHAEDSSAGRYGTIIGRDILTNPGIDLNISMNTTENDKAP